MSNQIVIAKVRTGELVVGKKTEIDIEECVQVKLVPKSPQNVEIAMAPFFPMLSDDFVTISLTDIITYATPVKDLEQKYLESISNIIIAPGNMNVTSMRRKQS